MKINLSLKITGILLIFTSVLFISLSIFNFSNLKNTLTESFTERAKATIHSLESGIPDKEYFNDTNKLSLIIQKNIWLDPDIEGITFYIPQGNEMVVYVSSNQNRVSQKPEIENQDSFNKDIFISKIIKSGDTEILESVDAVHISGEIVGTVQIDFDLGSINKKIKEAFFEAFLIYVVMIFLFLLLIYFFLNIIILKPILKINKGLKALAQNDFTYKVDVNSRDEIGSLAKAFGEMVTVVSGTKAEIESQVKKQTKSISEKSEELDNQKSAILNILEDVEKDKNKIELLAQDLEKFKLAVENASDQIVITDIEGIVVYGNNAVEKITGFKPEEALGKKAGALWKTPMSHEYYENMWKTIKEKKEVFRGEIQNKRKNGELYYANISVSPVTNHENKIIFFVAIEHDITKEKEIERKIVEEKEKVEKMVIDRTKELREEQARLLASINSLSFGFIIADMNHHVLIKNKAITELFGLSDTDDISIDRISDILGKDVDVRIEVEKCVKDKKICEIKEIIFGTKFLRGIIAPIITKESEENIGYVFLLEDITEARAIDKAKTEFVSLASHQLRTPLSAINWYTEMLLSGDAGELNGEQKEFLGEVITSSKRMSSLVGTLLNVSRIELGTFAINPEEKDLCELIDNEVRDLKVQIETKKIDLELAFNLKPAVIPVDVKLISIVIQNFLTNAIKYNADGGKVTITVDRDEKGGGVLLSVVDTGFGIPKENQKKIFTKMYRADNAMVLDAEGNGLGLYMVKSILETSGCEVTFESPPAGQDHGTAFHVRIPKEGMKQVEGNKRIGDAIS